MSLVSRSFLFTLVGILSLVAVAQAADEKKAEPSLPERIKAAGLAEKPFTLVVIFNTKPESASKLDPLVQRGATETHKEKGCLLYDAHKNPEVPGQYVFLERFQGIAGLEAHVATDYTKALLEAFAAEATAPPKITIVEQVTPTRK